MWYGDVENRRLTCVYSFVATAVLLRCGQTVKCKPESSGELNMVNITGNVVEFSFKTQTIRRGVGWNFHFYRSNISALTLKMFRWKIGYLPSYFSFEKSFSDLL